MTKRSDIGRIDAVSDGDKDENGVPLPLGAPFVYRVPAADVKLLNGYQHVGERRLSYVNESGGS